MAEEEIYSVGIWSVKQGKEEAFLKIWTDLANWTMANKMGGISVVMLKDVEQNNLFISYGPWTSLESVQKWRQQSEFKAAFVKLKEVCNEIKPKTMRRVISIP